MYVLCKLKKEVLWAQNQYICQGAMFGVQNSCRIASCKVVHLHARPELLYRVCFSWEILTTSATAVTLLLLKECVISF